MSVQPGYTLDRGEDGLTKQERTAFDLFRQGHKNAEVARQMGITRQRVGQIRKSLVGKGMLIESEQGSFARIDKK